MKVIIAGASGFLGSHLKTFFKNRGDELVLLSRSPKNGEAYWNPEEKKIDLSLLEGANVVINLAGENIFGRWTQTKLDRIHQSRFVPTEFLTDALLKLKNPPQVFINASAVGYYGDRGEEILNEDQKVGQKILPKLCEKWEEIPKKLTSTNIRVAFARFGVVLGEDGGILKKLKTPFKIGLGGIIASGKQYMSWIAVDDVTAAMEHVIQHQELSGPINFSSPNPVTNKEFTRAMSRVFKTPALMWVPKELISFIFGPGKEMFLDSTRAFPEKLLKSGFTFKYPDIESALKKYLLF